MVKTITPITYFWWFWHNITRNWKSSFILVLFWQVYTCLKLTELPWTAITTNCEGLIDTDPVRSLVTELSPHCCTACSRHWVSSRRQAMATHRLLPTSFSCVVFTWFPWQTLLTFRNRMSLKGVEYLVK